MFKTRVLFVDDAVVIRRQLENIFGAEYGMEVLPSASTGTIALNTIAKYHPDIVVLDVKMPHPNGFDVLKEIRATRPSLPVIMYSSVYTGDESTKLKALSLGATDFVTKPTSFLSSEAAEDHVRRELLPKIKQFSQRHRCHRVEPHQHQPIKRNKTRRRCNKVNILLIGASTGGPDAIKHLLQFWKKPLPVPLVIVQHMPPVFTRMFAERLSAQSIHPVRESISGQYLRAGDVWVAAGNQHLDVVQGSRGVCLRQYNGMLENNSRPSVDPLFHSAANIYGRGVLALILTGIGQDGLKGCQAVYAAGGHVLAQDETSSAVWGMPRVVTEAHVAEHTLPLDELAKKTQHYLYRDLTVTSHT